MRVLVVTPYYPPDLGPSAPLFGMLCEDLVRAGYSVTVLCAVPHFPSGEVPLQYRHSLLQRETLNGVRVFRLRVPSGNRSRLTHRLLVFAVYQLLSSIIGAGLKYDAILMTNPALETFLPFVILCALRSKPCLYAVYDLYPEIGAQLGIFRHAIVIGMVKWLEDYCLRRAAAIHALSNEFVPVLRRRSRPGTSIFVLSPWVDADFLHPFPRTNDFSASHDLDGRFVVMYSGNLGFSQGLRHVLNAAPFVPDVLFLFVGDGPAHAALMEQATHMELSNVRFLPFQPREQLPEMLSCADIALISLEDGVSQASLPSKTFPLMACGRPILAVVETDSELCRLLEESGAGICVPSGDGDAFINALISLRCDKPRLRRMQEAGRAYALQHFARAHAAEVIASTLHNLVQECP